MHCTPVMILWFPFWAVFFCDPVVIEVSQVQHQNGSKFSPPVPSYSLLLNRIGLVQNTLSNLKDCWCKIYLEYIDFRGIIEEKLMPSRDANKPQQPGRPLGWKGAFIIVFSTSVFIDRPTAAELLRHKFFTKAKVRKHFLNWYVQRLWKGLFRSTIGVGDSFTGRSVGSFTWSQQSWVSWMGHCEGVE